MASLSKAFNAIVNAQSDGNIRFGELRRVLGLLGFSERINGSHHIFTKPGVEEIINLQPRSGGLAKPYQVKQVRQIINKYGLRL